MKTRRGNRVESDMPTLNMPTLNMIAAVKETSLGAVLVLANENGVHQVRFLDDATPQRNQLGDHEPGPTSEQQRWIELVKDSVESPAPCPLLPPLVFEGTAFQRRVWTALLGVPPGETLTYTELAARIGKPTAVRAVASACAANVLAVVVPCHRIVRSDGGMGGYRWGVTRKRELLAREASRLESSAAGANSAAWPTEATALMITS